MAIDRRDILSGLVTLGLPVSWHGLAAGNRASAASRYLVADRAAGSSPMAATWQQATNDAIITDTTNDSLNSRARCTAPVRSALTDIVLAFPAWGLNATEQPWPCPYRVTATVEYPEGTFHPVFSHGKREIVVEPGFDSPQFDPCPIQIPAGAIFFVKTFVQWHGGFWLGRSQACASLLGEWTNRGMNLPDSTLLPTAFRTTDNAGGFRPGVFARLLNPTPVLGILGASQEMAFGSDSGDPVTGALFIGRAMRNQFPVINISRSGDSFAGYLYRFAGRRALLNGRITHLVLALGSNDIFGGSPADRTFNSVKQVADQFLHAGVHVYGMTVLPRTRSRDSWVTREGQTVVDAGQERQRIRYNALLQSHGKSIGLSDVFDCAHAIDPHDSGLWNVDDVSPGHGGGGFASIAQGRVTAVSLGSDGDYGPFGVGYPALSEIPCAVLNAPGDPHGTGAVATMRTNERGMGVSFTVKDAGRNYVLPPLIAAHGQWCNNDGVHECKRGYDAVIAYSDLRPERFLA